MINQINTIRVLFTLIVFLVFIEFNKIALNGYLLIKVKSVDIRLIQYLLRKNIQMQCIYVMCYTIIQIFVMLFLRYLILEGDHRVSYYKIF